MEQQMFVIGTIVENKPGVLHKVSNMLRRKGFNIESISVGPTETNDWARMTITFRADEATARQLVRQMEKLLDVVRAKILNQSTSVARELALVKLRVEDTRARSDAINYANVFRSRVVDVSPNTLMVEITGTPDKIDAFIQLARELGLVEVSRTGVTALERGLNALISEKGGAQNG